MNDIILTLQHQVTSAAPPHQHDSWELFYCTDGADTFVFDDMVLPYRAGDVIIIPPDTPHSLPGGEPSGSICLMIANAALALRYPMLLQDDGNHSLLHLFQDAHYFFHSGAEHRGALLPSYGQLITQHISVRHASSPRNLLVEELAQNIVQNYANPNYELDVLLKSAPYCYDYLCRLFRQELHTTPHKYLTNLRLQAAADALRTGTGGSITEVARTCGYSDPLYFSRMFKKKYGVSPREYAKATAEE